MAPINSLPPELLAKIISSLDAPAPSASRLHDQPNFNITSSPNTVDLKAVSRVTKQWHQIALPLLFRHARVVLPRHDRDIRAQWPPAFRAFLAFLAAHRLGPKVDSFALVVEADEDADHDPQADCGDGFPGRWGPLFAAADPRRVTLVAPPPLLGLLLARPVAADARREYNMPYHTASFGRAAHHAPGPVPAALPLPAIRPWTAALLNEGSFLRPCAAPEYLAAGAPPDPPSVLAALAAGDPAAALPAAVASFVYVGIFPPPAHTDALRGLLGALRRLEVRLVPRADLLPDPEQRAAVEPLVVTARRDWAYRSLLRAVRGQPAPGSAPGLREIACADAEVDGGLEAWREAVAAEITGQTEAWREDPERPGVLVRT